MDKIDLNAWKDIVADVLIQKTTGLGPVIQPAINGMIAHVSYCWNNYPDCITAKYFEGEKPVSPPHEFIRHYVDNKEFSHHEADWRYLRKWFDPNINTYFVPVGDVVYINPEVAYIRDNPEDWREKAFEVFESLGVNYHLNKEEIDGSLYTDADGDMFVGLFNSTIFNDLICHVYVE